MRPAAGGLIDMGLRDAVPETALHLCIDMQRLFAEDTPWRTPWMPRVAPMVERLVEARPHQTCFTRFVPPTRPEVATGAWRTYWERWREMTLERLPPQAIDLLPRLAAYAPPARILDKPVYSPWWDGRLHRDCQARAVDTLIVTGGETDVCVLAAVLGAMDLGYRVVVVTDALCSSADTVHDAALKLYRDRFSQQVETAETAEVLEAWRRS